MTFHALFHRVGGKSRNGIYLTSKATSKFMAKKIMAFGLMFACVHVISVMVNLSIDQL